MKVKVDAETGVTKLNRVVAGADIGTVINPILAADQIYRDFDMGWSMTTLEDTAYDLVTGCFMNKGFVTDYKLHTSRDIPP